MKIHPEGAKLFHVDGRTDRQSEIQTDMMKLIVAFCSCAIMPENNLLMMYQQERVISLWGGISFPVFYISQSVKMNR